MANIKLDELGNGTASIKTVYKGIQYENDNQDFMINMGYNDQKKWLYRRIDIPSFSINNFKYSLKKERIPELTEDLNLEVRKYCSKSNDRLFLPLNLMNAIKNVPRSLESRHSDIIRHFGRIENDSIIYEVPDGYEVEFLPEGILYESEFGQYYSRAFVSEGKVIYVRRLKMNEGIFPAQKYEDFRKFYKNLVRADQLSAVLSKDSS